MPITALFQRGAYTLFILGLVTTLTACGGGGGNSSSQISISSVAISSVETSTSSSVVASSAVSAVSSVISSSSVSSLAPDTTPDTFSFTPVAGASLSASITSAAITISGIDTATPVSITGGQYAIDNGAPTSNAGTISNGQTVKITLSTSATPSTITQAVLTVGGVVGAFSATTEAPDTTPDTFSFTPVTGAALSASITSAAITVSGINTATPISITGGQYAIDNGAPTSNAGTISNGQTVEITLSTAATPSTITQAVLTVGGVVGAFSATTEAPDTTPNIFSFTSATTGILNTEVTSNIVTVSGINMAAPISIAGGQYSIDGGAFTTAAGTINNGQTMEVKALSATGINSTTQAVLMVGGVTGTFSIITVLQNTTPYSMGGAIQGSALNIATVVTTLAGSWPSWGNVDGTGLAASFYFPAGITTDGTNLYIANLATHTIRKIVIATGVVTTLAGSGSTGSADGIGAAASFNQPFGVTIDGTNLYVCDSRNSTIRKIVIATGIVTTLAGSGSTGNADGNGTAASFNSPNGITTDGTSLYVSDSSNHTIRKIVIATGVVTTLAGSGSTGSADGIGTAASFNSPNGITTDGINLYISDFLNNTIRKIVIATGVVTTLAGSGSTGSTDGNGTAASFHYPSGITTDGTSLYVTDVINNTIRKIVIVTGDVTTLAGSSLGVQDGTGTSAGFFQPRGITTDGFELFVTDTQNNIIRKIH
jgi:hypothetical protein